MRIMGLMGHIIPIIPIVVELVTITVGGTLRFTATAIPHQ